VGSSVIRPQLNDEEQTDVFKEVKYHSPVDEAGPAALSSRAL